MDLLHTALDLFLHLDVHLAHWAGVLGPWLYLVLFAVIFCETGLVVTPFLPGDSLLFTVGALAAVSGSPVSLEAMWVVLAAGAVGGDAANYAIGHYLGPAIFTSERSRWLNPRHLQRTHEFYVRHGRKTIFLARFVPIVRTFAPFVAGIGSMPYRVFAAWNVTGALVWVGGVSLAGYLFGRAPFVRDHFELVILAIIALSLAPIAFEAWRSRRTQRAARAAAARKEAPELP